ncbi:hypothetical protein Hanom_Chr16g01520131 [Helianthus anomalus]
MDMEFHYEISCCQVGMRTGTGTKFPIANYLDTHLLAFSIQAFLVRYTTNILSNFTFFKYWYHTVLVPIFGDFLYRYRY